MRIGFFGTPELSAQILRDCFQAKDIEVAFVVTNPDAKSDRGQKVRFSSVKEVALEMQIPVFQPEKVRGNTDFFAKLATYNCDYFIVVAYGKILPNEILSIPKKRCVNVHGSILPKYRGASPIQSALLSGDTETGVTIMQMSEGMDEWDILNTLPIPIDFEETSATLFQKFWEVSGEFLISVLRADFEGKIIPISQNNEEATYCKKFTKEDGHADFSKSSRELFQCFQAYTPWPTLYAFWGEKRIIFTKTTSDSSFSEKGENGMIFEKNGFPCVKVQEGGLILKEVKLEWKSSMSGDVFLRTFPNFIGSILH